MATMAMANISDTEGSSELLPRDTLVETSSTYVHGKRAPVRLTNEEFAYGNEFLNVHDIIGCSYRHIEKSNRHFFEVYAYPKRIPLCCSNKLGARSAKHVLVEVKDNGDGSAEGNAKQWADTITRILYPTGLNHYLIFVNPVGGPGLAVGIFRNVVEPMLKQSGHTYQLVITERADHAKDMVSEATNLGDYTAVVAIGGDGLLYEIVQGISSRPDHLTLFKTLSLGIICGGSGNGICKSVLHECSEDYGTLSASFVLIKGKPREFDMSNVYIPGVEKPILSFLSFGWALLSDVDIESENLRWMGSARFTVGALTRMIFLRSYRARFSYLPVPPENGSRPIYREVASLPPLDQPVPENWVTSEDNFAMIWACQASHASHDLFTNPGAGLVNGSFTIFILRSQGVSRLNLLNMFMQMETGDHMNNQGVEIVRATAYRLEPLTELGQYSLDGEVIPYGPMQANIEAGMARIMSLSSGDSPW